MHSAPETVHKYKFVTTREKQNTKVENTKHRKIRKRKIYKNVKTTNT